MTVDDFCQRCGFSWSSCSCGGTRYSFDYRRANAPEKVTVAGVGCNVYPAGQYAAVDADVANERKDGRSAGAVARQMSLWAGIRGADNLRWLFDEMLADANSKTFKAGRVRDALKSLLFALHARPMHGHPLLTVEDAIEQANDVLNAQAPGAAG